MITFAATNIDDLFLLMLFFSDPSFRRRHIVFGQYLGFLTLILVSLLGFLGSFVITQQWLGALGIAPILIGIRKLVDRSRAQESSTAIDRQVKQVSQHSFPGSLLDRRMYNVAVVTVANGGDNLGIYTPLFANSDLPGLIVTICTFLVMVTVWCFAGYQLSRQPRVARVLARYGYVLVPLVLIALGIWIIVESEILTMFFQS